jgi:hypothetical protein
MFLIIARLARRPAVSQAPLRRRGLGSPRGPSPRLAVPVRSDVRGGGRVR